MTGYSSPTTVSKPRLDRISPVSITAATEKRRDPVAAVSQSDRPLAAVSMVVKIAAATTPAIV